MEQYEIDYYTKSNGFCPYLEWHNLQEKKVKHAADARLGRLRLGNFGDCKSVGEGVWELKINIGPGYRIYYKQCGQRLIVIFMAGHKKTQDENIKQAKEYAATL